MTEYVYFAQGKQSGNIKIGWTENLWQRLAHIQAHSGEAIDLRIHAAGNNLRACERHLHKVFKQFRLRGEWFSPGQPILDLIAQLRANRDPAMMEFYDGMKHAFILDPVDLKGGPLSKPEEVSVLTDIL